MLRAMRGAAQTWAIKLLLVFLVVSFAIWGVGDMFRGNPQQRLVACVGGFYLPFSFMFGSTAAICTGKRITVQTLQTEFQRTYQTERKKLGPDFTQKIARQLGYLDRALRGLTEHILFDRTVAENEILFDDALVLREIGNSSNLHTADGQFDTVAFRNAIKKLGMTEREFIDYAREGVQRDILLATLAGIATPPKIATEQILAAHGQERQLQALRLAHEALPVPAAPSEEELNKYYAGHAGQFTAPEYRSVSILKMQIDEISKNTVIPDQDIAAAFEKRRDEFALPERRDLLQIIVPDEAKANAVASAAKASKNLQQTAAGLHLKPSPMDDQTEQNILPSLYTNVFTADTGAIIGPVKTDFGWHVLQLTKIKTATQPVLDDVKDKLRTKLQQEHAADDIQNLANKVDDDLAGGSSLDEIAETYKFKIVKFPAIDAAGNTEEGKSAKMPMPDVTLKNAFGLNEGESSSLIDDHMGNYMVLHVDKIMPSHVRDIATIKDKVAAAWRADQQTQAAAAEAAKHAELWRQNPGAYDNLAKQRGMSIVTVQPVSLLAGFDKSLPRTMQEEIFALKPGAVTVGADAEAHYLVRLVDYKAFDAAKNIAAQTSLKSKLSLKWKEGLFDQYEVALQKDMPVHVNRAVLDELRALTTAND